jgi:DNA-binding PadR family transcriptional regulator
VSTRHVILALLHVQPATGYELAQSSTIATEPVWAATHSQIYPALHKLEEDGLVTSERGVRGTRLERRVYAITPEGERALGEWLAQPVQYLPPRDPFRLWASFMNEVTPEVAFRNIDEHIRRNLERAEHVERVADALADGDHPLIVARRGRIPEPELARIRRARSAMYRELARQARFEVESALRLRRVAEELFPDHEAGASPAHDLLEVST